MRKTIPSAALAAILLSPATAMTADPLCGDVNGNDQVSATDAQLVLRKGVGQPINLDCSAYDNRFSACEASLADTGVSLSACSAELDTCDSSLSLCGTDLSSTNSDLGACVDDLSMTNLELGACSADLSSTNADLAACLSIPVCGNGVAEDGEECDGADLNGFECIYGSPLRCASGCTFDTTACFAERFDATGDTILDRETGLEWEKKDSEDQVADFANPHDADNLYTWGSVDPPYEPNGTAYTDFLGRLNGSADAVCYTGRCDWRLPTLAELESLVVWRCGLGVSCAVDPVFLSNKVLRHWSSTTDPAYLDSARTVTFLGGGTGSADKVDANTVRAVRTGSALARLPRYSVYLALDAAPGLVETMALELGYADAPGVFAGPDGGCYSGVPGVSAINNTSGSPMTLALTSSSGGFGPTPLFECAFAGTGKTPVPADFEFTVTEASAPGGSPYDPELVLVSVGPITLIP